jgi:LmbE family N-acetylglucosaminyl deacetylase
MARVLVIAAHPDDEVLGCGGTIARHAAAGDDVHVVILAQGLMARPKARTEDLGALRESARKAGDILGVKDLTLHDFPDNRLDTLPRLDVTRFIESHVERILPEIVYTHHRGDVNIDHARANECTLAACRQTPEQSLRRLLFFEVPSSTEWGFAEEAFNPNWFVDISRTLDKKAAALLAYAGELRPFPHPRSEEAVTHLARWRGAAAGVGAAEAFVLARNVER